MVSQLQRRKKSLVCPVKIRLLSGRLQQYDHRRCRGWCDRYYRQCQVHRYFRSKLSETYLQKRTAPPPLTTRTLQRSSTTRQSTRWLLRSCKRLRLLKTSLLSRTRWTWRQIHRHSEIGCANLHHYDDLRWERSAWVSDPCRNSADAFDVESIVGDLNSSSQSHLIVLAVFVDRYREGCSIVFGRGYIIKCSYDTDQVSSIFVFNGRLDV